MLQISNNFLIIEHYLKLIAKTGDVVLTIINNNHEENDVKNVEEIKKVEAVDDQEEEEEDEEEEEKKVINNELVDMIEQSGIDRNETNIMDFETLDYNPLTSTVKKLVTTKSIFSNQVKNGVNNNNYEAIDESIITEEKTINENALNEISLGYKLKNGSKVCYLNVLFLNLKPYFY
jgi:hypothetical protein